MIITEQDLEGVLDPGHLSATGTHVWGGDINAGSNEALLGKLHGVPPGDPLKLGHGVLLGVNANTTLGALDENMEENGG